MEVTLYTPPVGCVAAVHAFPRLFLLIRGPSNTRQAGSVMRRVRERSTLTGSGKRDVWTSA